MRGIGDWSEMTEDTTPLFAERYQLKEKLGEGAMGEVHLAIDALLSGSVVALKILRKELVQDERAVERFLREVSLTRDVTHKNVVRTFDAGVYEGSVYLTMEHVKGRTLEKLISEDGIETEPLCRILIQICHGLTAIHEKNIVHRDLKPSNIIISDEGVVKIADFGVARPHVSDLTHHEEIVGSALYLPPELWHGKAISPASDLYALGVIGYQLATGLAPFDSETSHELMYKHLHLEPTPPWELNDKIPEWLGEMLLALLTKDHDARPYVAKEVSDFLSLRLHGEDEEEFDLFSTLPPEMNPFDKGEMLRSDLEGEISESAQFSLSEAAALEPGEERPSAREEEPDTPQRADRSMWEELQPILPQFSNLALLAGLLAGVILLFSHDGTSLLTKSLMENELRLSTVRVLGEGLSLVFLVGFLACIPFPMAAPLRKVSDILAHFLTVFSLLFLLSVFLIGAVYVVADPDTLELLNSITADDQSKRIELWGGLASDLKRIVLLYPVTGVLSDTFDLADLALGLTAAFCWGVFFCFAVLRGSVLFAPELEKQERGFLLLGMTALLLIESLVLFLLSDLLAPLETPLFEVAAGVLPMKFNAVELSFAVLNWGVLSWLLCRSYVEERRRKREGGHS